MNQYPVKVQVTIRLDGERTYQQIHSAIPVLAGSRKTAIEMARILYEDDDHLVVAVGEGHEVVVPTEIRRMPSEQWTQEWLRSHNAT